MRRITTLALSAMVMATTPLPATAGGWWTSPQLEHQTPALGIGESTTVTAQVMFPTADEAVAARTEGDYYAYLVRGFDKTALQEAMTQPQPDSWWTTPHETIQLGQLTFGRNDSNLINASVTFVVPDVEPGEYDLMLCNRGCSKPLADVVPLEYVYVGDPLTVRLMLDSAERVAGQMEELDVELAMVDQSVDAMRDNINDLRGRLDDIAASVNRMESSMASAAQPDGGRSSDPGGWLAMTGWLVAGAAVAHAWSTRRRDATKDAEAPELEPAVQIIHEDTSTLPEFVTRSS